MRVLLLLLLFKQRCKRMVAGCDRPRWRPYLICNCSTSVHLSSARCISYAWVSACCTRRMQAQRRAQGVKHFRGCRSWTFGTLLYSERYSRSHDHDVNNSSCVCLRKGHSSRVYGRVLTSAFSTSECDSPFALRSGAGVSVNACLSPLLLYYAWGQR